MDTHRLQYALFARVLQHLRPDGAMVGLVSLDDLWTILQVDVKPKHFIISTLTTERRIAPLLKDVQNRHEAGLPSNRK